MPSPQENTCEALAELHASVRVTPLGDGTVRADCLDRVRASAGSNIIGTAWGGLSYSAGWIVQPDGSKTPVRW